MCWKIVTDIVGLATLGVLIWYTVETFKIRKINAKQNDLQLLPSVMIFFRQVEGQDKVFIENIGAGTAIGIKITPITFTEGKTKFLFSFKLSGENDVLRPIEEREINISLDTNGKSDSKPLENFMTQFNPVHLEKAEAILDGNDNSVFVKELHIQLSDLTGQEYKTTLEFSPHGVSITKIPERVQLQKNNNYSKN